MNLGELRTHFMNFLNRSDCTSSLADTFIQLGFKRVHRKLRVPAMERKVELVADSQSRLVIPSDYLEMVALWEDGADSQMKKKTRDQFLKLEEPCDPGYIREGAYWLVAPDRAGSTFHLHYLGEMPAVSLDTDTNTLLDVLWDIFMYAGLEEAAAYFEDDRAGFFSAKYAAAVADVDEQTDRQDSSEGLGAISPGTSTEY